jgi:hypothetical protein
MSAARPPQEGRPRSRPIARQPALAQLLPRAGTYMYAHGLGLRLARALHERALAMRQRLYDDDHVAIATSLSNLATDLVQAGGARVGLRRGLAGGGGVPAPARRHTQPSTITRPWPDTATHPLMLLAMAAGIALVAAYGVRAAGHAACPAGSPRWSSVARCPTCWTGCCWARCGTSWPSATSSSTSPTSPSWPASSATA